MWKSEQHIRIRPWSKINLVCAVADPVSALNGCFHRPVIETN